MRPIARPRLSFPHLDDATAVLIADYPGRQPYRPGFAGGKWRQPHVLGSLQAMHGEVCAYCQGQLTPSDRGDVEHFRPKSTYWWLAYDFDNYLLSCARCNRVRKGKRFPLMPGEDGLKYGDGRDVSDEQQLLLDPTRDPVDGIAMKLLRQVWMLVPKKHNGEPDRQAEETIRFFELNLGQIPGVRQRMIATATEEAKKIRNGEGDLTYLHRLASRFQPYGELIRRVLARRCADLLPCPRDEARLLIADLRDQLRSYDAALEQNAAHKDTIALRKAALWALAVLWYSPPDGVGSGEISKWLGNVHRPKVLPLRTIIEDDLAKQSGPA